MYFYPFLLITEDDVRNSALADLIEEENLESIAFKKSLYERLPEHSPIRALHDLTDIQMTMNRILCEILRSNMNALKKPLPELDRWRTKEKLKRCLTLTRRKGADVLHPFDDDQFNDLLRKPDCWEEHESFKRKAPLDWNTVFLNRMSDVHRHMYRLQQVLEPNLLVKPIMPCDEDHHKAGSSSAVNDHLAATSKILEACKAIHRECKEYLRLVDSL